MALSTVRWAAPFQAAKADLVIGEHANHVEVFQVAEFVAIEFGQLTAEDEMQKLRRNSFISRRFLRHAWLRAGFGWSMPTGPRSYLADE